MHAVTSMTRCDLLPLPSSAKAESLEEHLFLGEAFYSSIFLFQENLSGPGLCGAELLKFIVILIESRTDIRL